jgi:aspartyl-tRNA(Asn)/glutamyl-tRNA(Gln) amidotransferase subunit C
MLNKKDIKHFADLARIGMTEEDLNKFSGDLSAVLDWIKQLEEVDIANISPTFRTDGLNNVFREDIVSTFRNEEKIVELFPEKKNNYDKVRSVL